MRAIDADRLLSDRMKSKYYHLPNGDIAIPLIDIKNAPTIKSEQRWIPVTEQMPDAKHADILVTYTDQEWTCVGQDEWQYGEFLYYGDKVIAWMPLPEPYKEG